MDEARITQADTATRVIADPGRVPVLVHGLGVLYRRFFDPAVDWFGRIRAEHAFQRLTESTKPGQAHRTGIYLTPVERVGPELRFRLLRCSTNLTGPTENFRATDRHIVDALNQEVGWVFRDPAPLNHVLAQIYPNTPATDDHKQTKAKIQAHADKTKDMPANGLLAFCTFYDRLDGLTPLPDDPYDHGHRDVSALTRLTFRLKVVDRPDLPAQFTVTLYPGSVFVVPLSTNRWYTHEIRPSTLDAARLPTRLGYVVRCSATEAVHADGQTFLESPSGRRPLQPPTPEGMADLRARYAEENRTDAVFDYAGFDFSMNQGDYLAPGYQPADEFRRYAVPGASFDELAVRFEDLGRGRQGAVLVRPGETRGTPIVRTTTRYALPAQRFDAAHLRLAQQIQSAASLPMAFNNALVERYTDAYATMGAHSDQAQDLEDGSFIALFSCYRDPERANRVLVVESKDDGATFEIPLEHDGVVVFSLDANRRFRHKIVLSGAGNEWLGVTFRTSRTFVRGGRLEDGAALTLADDQAIYALRGRENREPDFTWPPLSTTLSPSDLLEPS